MPTCASNQVVLTLFMYKVPPRANILVAKTRRPLQVDLKQQKIGQNGQVNLNSPEKIMTSPTLVFKKSPSKSAPSHAPKPQLTQNQEEMVKFVQSGWAQIMQEYETSQRQGNSKVVYYEPRNVNSTPNGFKPFELDDWFAQRMLKNLGVDA